MTLTDDITTPQGERLLSSYTWSFTTASPTIDETWDMSLSYATGGNPSMVGVFDLKGDSFPDLVTPNTLSGSISVLLNPGDGRFIDQSFYTVSDGPLSVTVANAYGHNVTVRKRT